jgi:predicted Rossmann fold flavoprotein
MAWPLAVVRAGAAGLLAATSAARAGCRTLLLETRPRPGAKIRVSGGGRCNVLPSVAGEDDFWTGGSRPALRNVLLSWPLAEVRAHFERTLGVALQVEPSGKVFPVSGSSREVVDALLADADRAGVTLAGDARVAELTREAAGFRLVLASGAVVPATRVILTTGGLSLPKTGSDGAGYAFARAFGHTVRPPYPALVPLMTDDAIWTELAGVALPAELRVVRAGRLVERRRGDFLFTHRGFSGPVALDVSRHFTAPGAEGTELRAAWGADEAGAWDGALAAQGRGQVATIVRERVPRRLADALLGRAGVNGATPLAQLRREERRALLGELTDCRLSVTGNEGYRTAEVTGGGVPLEELHGRTLESRLVPGLHFAGEILDVTGRLGGYNFLWAWVSGRRSGEGAARAAATAASPGDANGH